MSYNELNINEREMNMGTRGAIGFRFNDEDKVTYNHWESYPSGLGVKVAEVVQKFNDEQLAGAAARLTLVNESDPVPVDLQERYRSIADTNVGNQSLEDWYCVLRSAQGELAPYIDGTIDHMMDSADFLQDSLFCEWAYILNCDTRELEVYAGFNKDPNGLGRYAGMHRERDGAYYGVELLASIPFDQVRNGTETATELMDRLESYVMEEEEED